MPKRDANSNYNTHLASEFLMMSLLNRAGKEAYLSMGNQKGVDIVVRTMKGAIGIVEVKGLNKRNDWLITNTGKLPVADNLFYALICFNGKIGELETVADFWMIPSSDLKKKPAVKLATNKKTIYLRHADIRENYKQYYNTLDHLDTFLAQN